MLICSKLVLMKACNLIIELKLSIEYTYRISKHKHILFIAHVEQMRSGIHLAL